MRARWITDVNYNWQETHHQMTISKRDVTYIILCVFLLTLIDRYPQNRKCPIRHKIDPIQVKLTDFNWSHANSNLQNIYSTSMSGLRVFVGPPMYHLAGSVISAPAVLIYINVQPEKELSSSTRFRQSQKFGALSSHPPQGNNFCTWSEFSCGSNLTFLAPLNSGINKRYFQMWGSKTIISSHTPYRARNCTIWFYGYDFLLVINCIRGRILHRFW